MKRIIAFMLCLVLLASNVVVARAANTVEMTITPDKTQVARGETVEFTVTVPETTVRSAGFTLGSSEDGLYDNKVLEFVDGTCPVDGAFIANAGLTGGIPSGSLVFMSATKVSGTIFTFRMKVLEDAALGETTLTVFPSARDASGDLSCTANTVTLTVEEPEAPPTEPPVEEPEEPTTEPPVEEPEEPTTEPPVETSVEMTITPDKTQVAKGETVEFTISVPETAVRSAGFSLGDSDSGFYDPAVLAFVDGTCPVAGAYISNVGLVNGIPSGSLTFQSETNVSGTIFTFRMQVLEDATLGETILTVSPALRNGSGAMTCTVNTVTLTVEEPEAPPAETKVEVTITPDKTQVTRGETVEFTISVPETTVRSAGFSLGNSDSGFYDPAVLAFVGGTCPVAGTYISNVGLVNGIPSGSLTFQSETNVSGTIFTFQMQVLEDATLGKTTLTVSPALRDASGALTCNINTVTLQIEEPEAPPAETKVEVTITPDKTQVTRGETVEFTISVPETTVRSAGFSLGNSDSGFYDPAVLAFVGGTCPVAGTYMSNVGLVNGIPSGSLAFTSDTKVSGTIFTFQMKVLEDAILGETTLTVSPALRDASGALTCNINTVTLQIEEPEAPPIEPPVETKVEVTVTPDKTEVTPEEIVEFTVSIPSTENVRSAGFVLEDFDSDLLEFVDGTCPVAGTVLSQVGITNGLVSGVFSLESAADLSGTIFTFRMKVKAEAALGETTLTVSPSLRNDAGALTCTANTVTLKIAEPEAPPVEPPVEYDMEMTLTPDKTQVARGEIVEFTLSMPEATVKAAGFSLYDTAGALYDTSILEFVDGKCVVSNAFMGTVSVTGGKPHGAMAFLNATTVSGPIFTFRMKALEDATLGETTLTVLPSANDGESLSCTANTVTLEITCAHSWGTGQIVAAPTCAADGAARYVCEICGEAKIEAIAKLDHTWDAGKVTKEPTCAAEGVKIYTCAICGETRTEAIEKTQEHTWDGGEITTAPTCTAEGIKTITCTVCGATKTETVAMLGHNWDGGKITTLPTCVAEGTKTYTCANCSETRTEAVAKLDHDPETKVTKEATCTAEGVKTTACTACGEVIKTEAIPMLGHTWDEGKVTKEPTCALDGEKCFTCANCDETKIEVVEKTGNHVFTKQIIDEAHKVPGTSKYYYGCEHCDAIGTETFSYGDMDGDGDVDVDDAVYLLQYVLMPNLFPVQASPDVNKNGVTNVDDAIYLLQHVLMPELFPL